MIIKPEPGDRLERCTFEGAQTTTRSRAMIVEARRLFRESGGGRPPAISQGGYNKGGVKASAGTHDRDAADWATRLFSPARRDLWQRAMWQVGYPTWIRYAIPRVWPAHSHSIPAGGDLAPLAKSQVNSFRIGRDGLAGNRRYPGIIYSGFMNQTWEKYLAKWKAPNVSLASLGAAWSARQGKPLPVASSDVLTLQRALNGFLLDTLYLDGDPGPKTKASYAKAAGLVAPALDVSVLLTLDLEVSP